MSFWEKITKGTAEGLLGGVGDFVKDVRTAITGKEPMTAEQIIKLDEQAKALEQAVLNADVTIAQGQMDINKVEAASSSLFRGGWRPAVGWICAFSLAYQFLM
ncbi:MAG TPA: 3TM-type holin, partial [Candidatus Limnocylindrales bacterium]|nr:3TM-type holin [Candidatus Limnocylindrales bacterium]